MASHIIENLGRRSVITCLVISSAGIKGPWITEGNVEGKLGALTSCSGSLPSCLGPGVVEVGGISFLLPPIFPFTFCCLCFGTVRSLREGITYLSLVKTKKTTPSLACSFLSVKG